MPAVSLAKKPIAAASELTARKMRNERCSNPFRIPRHEVITGLRLVPQEVRDRLAHVNFGRKVCHDCRMRVYRMIKERRQCKPSPRLTLDSQITARRKSEPVIATTATSSSDHSNAASTSNVKPPPPPSATPVNAAPNLNLTPRATPSPEDLLMVDEVVDDEPIVPNLSRNSTPPSRLRSSLPNLTGKL